MTHRFPTGVQSLCTGDVCHVPIAEGVSTFYILFQPKCNRRFIFTWSVIYFTVFYANSMTYYLKNLKCQLQVSDCRQSPRLFAEDFSVLKRLKVSIFKTFQSLFGIIKVSKKAVLFYDDTRNRKSKKANADGMY